MDEIDRLKKLSLDPLSCESLRRVGEIWRTIRVRYPNTGEPISTPGSWVQYASKLSQSNSEEDDDILPSVRRLARGESVDEETMRACLGLLRADPSPCEATVADVRSLGGDEVSVQGDGLRHPSIIPFLDGEEWAFAVAYPDCVHWYDSRHGAEVPLLAVGGRPLVTGWTGPKQRRDRPEDSGIFALMGIRRIYQGCPHLGQQSADEQKSLFRTRLLAELICGKTEPSEDEFSAVAPLSSEDRPSFFADAFYGGVPPASASPSSPITPPPSPPRRPRVAEGRSRGPRQAREPRARLASTRASPDDRRTILGHLSDAVLASRSVQMSSQTSLAVLWQCLKGDGRRSALHERYSAVLFHGRMESLRSANEVSAAMNHPVSQPCLNDMRSTQAQCELWRDICELRQEWGSEKYSLLLAVPSSVSVRSLGPSGRRELVSELRSRLDDASDPLEGWLEQARALCVAIINNSLPSVSLMMDVYHLKRNEGMSAEDFRVFTSVDPRVKRALPRSGGEGDAVEVVEF